MSEVLQVVSVLKVNWNVDDIGNVLNVVEFVVGWEIATVVLQFLVDYDLLRMSLHHPRRIH